MLFLPWSGSSIRLRRDCDLVERKAENGRRNIKVERSFMIIGAGFERISALIAFQDARLIYLTTWRYSHEPYGRKTVIAHLHVQYHGCTLNDNLLLTSRECSQPGKSSGISTRQANSFGREITRGGRWSALKRLWARRGSENS